MCGGGGGVLLECLPTSESISAPTIWVNFVYNFALRKFYLRGQWSRGGGHSGTHCKTDSRSCGCRLEKRGLSQTQELSGGGLSEGHFLLGL